MIRVLLEIGNEVIAVAGRPGIERYLCQINESLFPILSQVDTISYATFSPSDMAGLLAELSLLHDADGDLAEVVALAARCKDSPETLLTFTPFDE